MANVVVQYYQTPGLSQGKLDEKLIKLKTISENVQSIQSEFCFYIQCRGKCRSLM